MTKTKLQQAIEKAKRKPIKKPAKVNIAKIMDSAKKKVDKHNAKNKITGITLKKQLPDKQDKAGRDKDGKFKSGYSGNPKGREKGLSITEMIRKELIKDRKVKGKTKKSQYAVMLVTRILEKAIQQGDQKMIEKIWAYIDGTPTQMVDAKVTGDLSLRELCQKAKDE